MIQKKYEILSDIVIEYNAKVHGSQRDRDPKTGFIDLLIYYEVPMVQREEVKHKFDNLVRNSQTMVQRIDSIDIYLFSIMRIYRIFKNLKADRTLLLLIFFLVQ
jgi:hypothetical protein